MFLHEQCPAPRSGLKNWLKLALYAQFHAAFLTSTFLVAKYPTLLYRPITQHSCINDRPAQRHEKLAKNWLYMLNSMVIPLSFRSPGFFQTFFVVFIELHDTVLFQKHRVLIKSKTLKIRPRGKEGGGTHPCKKRWACPMGGLWVWAHPALYGAAQH
ncbi:hypothetical protein B0H17DRAFT_1135698 [Mycena rosella]|uniref:Uncharacterized protein n=1 Tax=Mycena rosella TaxID=1033263 RepID=A0AAD7DCP5_MYCRO|nr:hypothetical protein B0H17DRAFT_1135698 [Mycena rosella]